MDPTPQKRRRIEAEEEEEQEEGEGDLPLVASSFLGVVLPDLPSDVWSEIISHVDIYTLWSSVYTVNTLWHAIARRSPDLCDFSKLALVWREGTVARIVSQVTSQSPSSYSLKEFSLPPSKYRSFFCEYQVAVTMKSVNISALAECKSITKLDVGGLMWDMGDTDQWTLLCQALAPTLRTIVTPRRQGQQKKGVYKGLVYLSRLESIDMRNSLIQEPIEKLTCLENLQCIKVAWFKPDIDLNQFPRLSSLELLKGRADLDPEIPFSPPSTLTDLSLPNYAVTHEFTSTLPVGMRSLEILLEPEQFTPDTIKEMGSRLTNLTNLQINCYLESELAARSVSYIGRYMTSLKSLNITNVEGSQVIPVDPVLQLAGLTHVEDIRIVTAQSDVKIAGARQMRDDPVLRSLFSALSPRLSLSTHASSLACVCIIGKDRDEEMLQTILSRTPEEVRNAGHWHPLQLALWSGNFTFAKALLRAGLDPRVRTMTNQTLIELAMRCEHGYDSSDITGDLIRAGCPVNNVTLSGEPTLYLPTVKNYTAVMKLLLESGAIADPDTPKRPILYAHSSEALSLLLQYGADPRPRPTDSHSCMAQAMRMLNVEWLEFFAHEMKCDPNLPEGRNHVLWTLVPLISESPTYLVMQCVQILIDVGVDITKSADPSGKTVLEDIAELAARVPAAADLLGVLLGTPSAAAAVTSRPTDILYSLLVQGTHELPEISPAIDSVALAQLAIMVIEKGASFPASVLRVLEEPELSIINDILRKSKMLPPTPTSWNM